MTEASRFDLAIDRGLEGVVACSSAISTIDGTTLLYRGYEIEDLAAHAGKLDVDTPRFVIESDATIVAPLIFGYVLDR